MARLVRRKCPCLRPKMEEEVRILDYRHSSLTDVPSEVFNWERTLEELYTDSNQIRDLPRELFYCHGLRKLSVSDNEITTIPPAIAGLDYLEELDFSKNGIIDVPDNIKCCKYLRIIDASVNPLGKLPDGFTQLQNLTHLYLNDTFLDYLPGSFGRLVKLRMVEMRENHLKTLPKSFGRLTELERLDIGNNEFTELPDVVGSLPKLLELWCDNNQMASLTHTLGGLKQLIFLDASKNQLTSLPGEIEGCTSLADLHLTSNCLRSLPPAIGSLSSLTTLKVDDNQLASLPPSLGGLTSLSELNVSVNDLEELPSGIGLLRNLRTFYADDNLLGYVPAELGSCSGITVLSLRSNRLTYIPDEIGRIPRLRVLNLSDNRLSYLPFTIVKLKELQALWLTENQTRPLIPLQSDYEPETGRKVLTCYLLPQGHHSPHDEGGGGDGDSDSFHGSMWDEQRLQRQQIQFSFDDDDDDQGHLVRCPTPYPKEMREKARHMRNLALRQSVSDSTQEPSRSPQSQHSHSARQQGRYLGSEEGTSDGNEAKPCQSHSPSLQETHRLYSCDKEKQMRDKARMHHSQSLPTDVAALSSAPAPAKRGGSVSGTSDTEEGRVAGRRKSTPNLFSFEGQTSEGKQPRRMPSFTYEDLYQKQILRKHHHHGRRSRRMREYDSDTGYRSDREVSVHRRHDGDLKDDLSVRSQPAMSRSHRHRREGGGYTSDLEAYAGRGRGGLGRGSGRGSTAPSPKPRTVQSPPYSTSGVPQDPSTPSSSADTAQDNSSTPFRPQYRLAVPSSRPDLDSHQQSAAPPSPAQVSGSPMPDQGREVTSQPPEEPRSPEHAADCSRPSRPAADLSDSHLQTELRNVLEERNRNIAAPHQKPTFSSSSRQNPTVTHTPPPYQPAPPYRRPSDRGSERSDSSGVPRSPRDSDLGSSSFSNPEYSAPQCREGSDSSETRRVGRQYVDSGDHGDVFQPPSDRRYSEDGGDPVRLSRYYRESENTGSSAGSRQRPDYLETGGDLRVSSDRQYQGPVTALQDRTEGLLSPGPGQQQCRTRQQATGQVPQTHGYELGGSSGQEGSAGLGSSVGQGSSSWQGSSAWQGGSAWQSGSTGQGARTSYEDSSSDAVSHSDSSRHSGQDFSVSSHGAPVRGPSSRHTALHSRPANSRTSSYPDHSRDNLTPVRALYHHPESRHSPHHPYTSTPFRPRAGSREDVLEGPVSRTVPQTPYEASQNSSHKAMEAYPSSSSKMLETSRGVPQTLYEASSSSSQKTYLNSSPKMFETYPNPYGEPLEVGDPLMRRFEDVVMFKSMRDPSQVSSSTDSGYGHGHPIYERIGDFSAKRSGSPYSSTPSHRGTPVRRSSSSQGTASRENTPVREETLSGYPVQYPPTQHSRDVFRTVLHKKPGLGFSIAGGTGCQDLNPYRSGDSGIFVTKVQAEGPAASLLQPGDKLLQVNHVDFTNIDHTSAVNVLKTASSVDLLVERVQKINMV